MRQLLLRAVAEHEGEQQLAFAPAEGALKKIASVNRTVKPPSSNAADTCVRVWPPRNTSCAQVEVRKWLRERPYYLACRSASSAKVPECSDHTQGEGGSSLAAY